jgi:hypothetical protein
MGTICGPANRWDAVCSCRQKYELGRGHYDKDRPAIVAWVSYQGSGVIQTTRDFTVKTVQETANRVMQAGSRLYTDSASNYQALQRCLHLLQTVIN